MRVIQVMKVHVSTVAAGASLSEAADLMDIYQVSSLPVLSAEGDLLGMIAESDLWRAALSAGNSAARDPVDQWMTAPAVQFTEDTSFEAAFTEMRERGMKRAPVLTVTGQLVGMLNRIDLIEALFDDELRDAPESAS